MAIKMYVVKELYLPDWVEAHDSYENILGYFKSRKKAREFIKTKANEHVIIKSIGKDSITVRAHEAYGDWSDGYCGDLIYSVKKLETDD